MARRQRGVVGFLDVVLTDPVLDVVRSIPRLISLRLVARSLGRDRQLLSMLDLAVAVRRTLSHIGEVIVLTPAGVPELITGECRVCIMTDLLNELRSCQRYRQAQVDVRTMLSMMTNLSSTHSVWRRLVLWNLLHGEVPLVDVASSIAARGRRSTRAAVRRSSDRRSALTLRLAEGEASVWEQGVATLLITLGAHPPLNIVRPDVNSVVCKLVPRIVTACSFAAVVELRRKAHREELVNTLVALEYPDAWIFDGEARRIASWVFRVDFAA